MSVACSLWLLPGKGLAKRYIARLLEGIDDLDFILQDERFSSLLSVHCDFVKHAKLCMPTTLLLCLSVTFLYHLLH